MTWQKNKFNDSESIVLGRWKITAIRLGGEKTHRLILSDSRATEYVEIAVTVTPYTAIEDAKEDAISWAAEQFEAQAMVLRKAEKSQALATESVEPTQQVERWVVRVGLTYCAKYVHELGSGALTDTVENAKVWSTQAKALAWAGRAFTYGIYRAVRL